MKKKGLKAIYFQAYWDGCFEERDFFADYCKENKIPFEFIDAESENGVKMSIMHTVRDCPTILFFQNGKEIARYRGKDFVKNGADFINE